MTKTIVVTGATGQVGRAVVQALAAQGFQVRAATRDPGRYGRGANIHPVKFDYHDEQTVAAALVGANGLFLIALPLDSNAPDLLRPVIDRAKEAKVGHIVLNSAFGVDSKEEAPLRIVERYLMDSGIPFTVLRPNFFMDNFSSGSLAPMINESDGLFLAAGDGKTSFIATSDIAAVTAAAFEKVLVGKEFNLTGPEALDHRQVAAIISKVAGRWITYEALSENDFLELLHKRGLPVSAAQYLADLYEAVRVGFMDRVTGDVLEVTGREPIRFSEFAEQHAGDWIRLGSSMPSRKARKPAEGSEVHQDW